MTRIVGCAGLLWVLVFAGPVGAQDPDDWEEQDRRYQERLQRRTETPSVPDDPEAAASELRARYLEAADRLIRDRNFAFESGAGIEVRTDDPRVDVRAAADLLISFRKHFDAMLAGQVELADYPGPAKFYLFWSYAEFHELTSGKARFDDVRPAGHYRPALDVCTVHTDGVPQADLADVLVHESAHQLFENRVLRGASRPPWLDEGLAEYFGFTARAPDGAFRPGAIGGKNVALFRDAGSGKPSGADRRLRALDKGVRDAPSFRIDDVLRLEDPARYYGEGLELHYGASFAAVHFLLHGDDGAHAAAFWKWVAGARRSPPNVDDLYLALGLDREAFHQRVVKHGRSLR